MTDSPATPNAAFDYAAWEREEREHAARADDLLPANKDALFDALAAAGITTVIVTLEGYGDSGQIANIETKAGDQIIALPLAMIEIANPVWGTSETERQSLSISKCPSGNKLSL